MLLIFHTVVVMVLVVRSMEEVKEQLEVNKNVLVVPVEERNKQQEEEEDKAQVVVEGNEKRGSLTQTSLQRGSIR